MGHARNAIYSSLLVALFGLGACTSMPMNPSASSHLTTTRLAGNNEVPSTNSTGSGGVDVTLNRSTNVVSWNVSYTGLTGPVTAGHFHGPAPWAQNAGVVVPFTGNLTSPITGSATLTPAQAADLLAGKWYVNLHTSNFPRGEIRTQITF
jgi:hypothetical protein